MPARNETRLCARTEGTQRDYAGCFDAGIPVADSQDPTNGTTASPGALQVFYGPVLARRRDQAFVDVHAFHSGFASGNR